MDEEKAPAGTGAGGYSELSISDDSANRPAGKKSLSLKEINRQNRLFWKTQTKKFKKQIERSPEFVAKAINKMEAAALSYGFRSVHPMECEVDKLVGQRKLEKQLGEVKLNQREKRIWNVIQQGSEGEQYCRELHNARVKPCKSWVDEDCPANYVEAYREGMPWRKRIQDEKYRIKARIKANAELVALVKK